MIIIGRGLLYRDGGEAHSVTLPALTYQVRDLNGALVTSGYSGPGIDNGKSILLGRADSCSLAEYNVDEQPTQESVEARKGAFARLDQLRATYPAKASEAFREGWLDANRQLQTESKEARAERVRWIKWERGRGNCNDAT